MASGGSASATVAASKRRLIGDFIFEVADSGGKATVGSHVRIADEAQAGAQAEALDADLERNTMALQLLASARRNPSLLFNVKVWLVGNLRFHQTVPDR